MTSPQENYSFQSARANYFQLTKTEQVVLQFLSIIIESTHRTNLAKWLREAGILGDNGKALTTMELAPIMERLTKLNLVSIDKDAANQYQCAPVIASFATQSAITAGQFHKMSSVVLKELSTDYNFFHYKEKSSPCLVKLRIAIFSKESVRVATILQSCRENFMKNMKMERPFVQICATPFDVEWFRELPLPVQAEALNEIVPYFLENFASVSDIIPLMREFLTNQEETNLSRVRKLLVTILIFQGHVSEAQVILNADEPVENGIALQGWIHFLRGENEDAINIFESTLKLSKKIAEKKQIIFGEISGIFYLLALLKSSDPLHRVRLGECLEMAYKNPKMFATPVFLCVEAALLAQQNKVNKAFDLIQDNITRIFNSTTGTIESAWLSQDCPLIKLFKAVAKFWIDKNHARKNILDFDVLFNQARLNGYQWAAMEIATLLVALDQDVATYGEYADTVQQSSGMHSILPIISQEEGWERALKAMIQLGTTAGGKIDDKPSGNSRLVWMIEIYGNSVSTIQPREQTRTASGSWSKGRPVALKRLYQQNDDIDFMTEQDRRICSAISRDSDYYGGPSYDFLWSKAMLAMVGHPLVFWSVSPQTNVEVVKSEPELLVEQKGGQVNIRFSGTVEKEGVIAIKETPTRCKLVEITKAHKQLAEIIGGKSLRIPAKGKKQVMQAMQALSPLVTIHSGIGGSMANVEEVPADATPHIHLLPHGEGLKVNLMVRPFSGDGPYFQLGKGGKTIIAEVNGKRVQTNRNLRDESKRANVVLTACPILAAEEGQSEWVLEEPESCLELLLNLQTVADQVVVAWPEGEKMRVGRPVAMDSMRVQVQRDQDWFSVTGELQVDESLVMGMAQLLDLVRGKESRFVPLGDGKFLALTETFRKRLAEIDSFSEKGANGRRFHPLAGSVFQELFADASAVEADSHWKAHLKRIEKAQGMDPALPSTLRAELRDYQVVGFRWLARLAAWGVGACLADDMGLGKTIQTLALLLHRAQEGPSLVVAPTSVGLNWLGEIDRFAPTLNGIVFGSGQRQQTLETLKPFDVVICSYGLLQQESEMLATVRWNVIVLDEAQAIKNRLTKRSQAAMALTGSFRVATTGTPVENHLGELWNLFQFLNPGLLGSLEVFNERFAAPIERQGDKGAQKRLRKLIQPFLLRRLKSQVLEELPSRTEIVLHVEMSSEEMAFYETLRRKAIENIESLDGPAEQKRFQILAELMRLRRACCNSRLVLPDSPIESTKLAIFLEVVEELLENRHKALVFSQFVDHLSIIRALLDEKKISYQYLDGSTPAKERKRRVDAFQAGEGDVFLISLRAGGMGINLTAADYVIHMDPWWNPAVEDQASDRAHRIGQLRPVTIYRLVTKETIEEKIVDLHRHKRDLADGLLEGGEMSGKLSVDDLLNMIRGRE